MSLTGIIIYQINCGLLCIPQNFWFMFEQKSYPKEFNWLPGDEYTGGVDDEYE